MVTPCLSNCRFASRNSDASMVHPEVLALGKRKRRMRWPLKSLRVTALSSSDLRWMLGALSPGLSMGFPLHPMREPLRLAAALSSRTHRALYTRELRADRGARGQVASLRSKARLRAETRAC